MKKIKKINFVCLAIALISVVISFVYYKVVCSTGGCSYETIKNIIVPIETAGYFLIGFFFIFLFLPVGYFKVWLKCIFSWSFPLVVYLTYITTGSSSIPAYGKVDIVRFWGMFFGVVTLVFIAVYYLKNLQSKK